MMKLLSNQSSVWPRSSTTSRHANAIATEEMPQPSIFSLPPRRAASTSRVNSGGSETSRLVRISEIDADGNVDEENPAPAPVIGDPSAERRADGRRGDDRHAVEREGGGAFRGGKRVDEDCLLDRREAAAADSLQACGRKSAAPRLGAKPQRSELTVKSATQIM